MLYCAHCARCNYLTVSEHYGDCGWHAVCDTRALVPSRHHRTHARLPLEALTTPTITARPRGCGACAAAQQWVVVLSTGRAGSTTILQMLNAAAPLVALSGEQTDWGARPGDRSSLLSTLWGALELSLVEARTYGLTWSTQKKPLCGAYPIAGTVVDSAARQQPSTSS